jgi:hypothetical protein
MYSLLLVFSTASLLFEVRAVRHGRTSDWVAFGACCAGMIWTHYFGFLQVIAQFGVLGVYLSRMRRDGRPVRPLVIGCGRAALVMLALIVPLAPFVHLQFGHSGQLSGLNVPSRNPQLKQLSIYAILANLVWAIWGYHSGRAMQDVVALWPLIMLLIFFLLGRGRPRVLWLLAASIAVPVGVLFIAGLRLRDLFEVRYFITIVPVIILAMAHFITRRNASRIAMAVFTAVLLSSFGVALADQQINQSNPRLYDFRGALRYVDAHANGDDLIFYSPRYLDSVVAYYTHGVPSRAAIRGPVVDRRPREIFVVTAWKLVDRRERRTRIEPIIRREIRYRALVGVLRRPGVEVDVWR